MAEWSHHVVLRTATSSPFFCSYICPGPDLFFIGDSRPPVPINVTGFGETTCWDVYAALYPYNSIPSYVCASLQDEVGDTCCTDSDPLVVPTISPGPTSAATPDTATYAPNSPAASPGFPVWTVVMMLAGASFMAALH